MTLVLIALVVVKVAIIVHVVIASAVLAVPLNLVRPALAPSSHYFDHESPDRGCPRFGQR